MALVIPSMPAALRHNGGRYRELDIVDGLAAALPDGFEIFHGMALHTVREGQDFYGEIDIVVMAPSGALLLMEVKAGEISLRNGEIFKLYTSGEHDVGRQCRLQRTSLQSRLGEARLETSLTSCLVIPDYQLGDAETVSIPRERIVDADQYPQLGALVRSWLAQAKGCRRIDALRQFLHNQFRVSVDLSVARDQLQRTARILSDGLATWIPRITAPSGVIRIQATAGSGKTQLALRLLEAALEGGSRVGYVCYNRTLADAIRTRAPVRAEVVNFHELAVEHWRRVCGEPDFTVPQMLERAAERFVADCETFEGRFDLLVIDEGQDFEPDWIVCLGRLLRTEGKLYLMEDDDQRLYERPDFDFEGAVTVSSRDNYRSPRLICDLINALRLGRSAVNSASLYKGEVPGFHLYSSTAELLQRVEDAVKSLLARGFALSDIAVLSNRGRASSVLASLRQLGPWSVRQFTGSYDQRGEPVWTDGELLVESVYRYKGQSAPAIVLAEVAFETLLPQEKRKLFVGLTRAQMAVEIVLTASAEQSMLAAFNAEGWD